MRKHFDFLRRSTFFLANGPMGDVIALCRELGFGHILLGEHTWSRASGWYESSLPGGHGDLKRFVREAHKANLLVSLHTRTTRVGNGDPLVEMPVHGELEVDGNLYYVDPYSKLQGEMAARLVAVADLVLADGLYLDGAETAARKYPDGIGAAITTCQNAVITRLTRPMLMQSSSTLTTLFDWWCFKGQIDHYIHKVKAGWEGTRAEWNEQYIKYAQQAMAQGYPAQLGWIDVGHGQTHQGKPIEDQSPESLQQLCDWATDHNVPIVLQTTLEELDTHPKRDEIKAVIKKFHLVKE